MEEDGLSLADEMDCRSHNSSPVRRRAQQRLTRVKGALNRSCSVPDSNNPPSLSPPAHGNISIPISDLTEIGADDHVSCTSVWSNRLQRLNRGKSCDAYTHNSTEDYGNSADNQRSQVQGSDETLCIEEESTPDVLQGERKDSTQDLASPCSSCQDLEMAQESPENQSPVNHNLYFTNNHMTKSMLCLNEESQDEWISLRELLSRCGRRLTVNELWALCYTCLSSLQTYIDFPAYLCLDTVYVGCEGEVLFLKPKNIGPRDEFYLAPEYQEHGIVTEKVCVYAVAAILWATAKFSLSPTQKLAMPRKLKRLLLEMAKRTPMERPTIIMAKKTCRDYLLGQETNAETVWNDLISRVHPPVSQPKGDDDFNSSGTHHSSSEDSEQNDSSFVPMATESRLAPVPGPVPYSYPVSTRLQLPEAFTSTATHFVPIVLTNKGDTEEEGQNIEAVFQGDEEEFTTRTNEVEGQTDDVTALPGCPCPVQAETGPHTEEPLMNFSLKTLTSTFSSDKTLASSSRNVPDIASVEVSLPSSSTGFSGGAVFNNYLFCQDPETGHLSLVPVQVRAPESFLGLDINLSLVPQPFQRLITVPEKTEGPFVNCLNAPTGPEKHSATSAFSGQARQNENQPSAVTIPNVHPALQDVINLLRGEFSFKGYFGDGQEDVAVGEYVFSLKDLEYDTFAGVVKERFSDLYWEEDLLGVLHCLVNNSPSTLSCSEKPSSKAVKSVHLASPLIPSVWREKEVSLHSRLDLNGNIHISDPDSVDSWRETDAECHHAKSEAAPADSDLKLETQQDGDHQGITMDTSDTGLMEGGDDTAGVGDESPSEVECPSAGEAELLEACDDEQMSPDSSEDMEDSGSPVSEQFLAPGSKAGGLGLFLRPAWYLAIFEEQCFSPEVTEYAVSLGQHTGTPCLDVKRQELQQQLMIETKNLKKTRNFYLKLLQQERKHKGSANKQMLSKLKSQLEELRSKVVFLESVMKYLQILSVEQWGLEVSLLPSLVSGLGSVDLHPSEDVSFLNFGNSKEKRILQAGSPQGLMAYLYSRNAASEGYIQQFLYTYRFLCTPEQLLQFLMNTFISAARHGPETAGESTKILHRTLDLLQFWITTCTEVDFTPKYSLVATLENFINTEVIPSHTRGQVLLAALHNLQNTSGGQNRLSPTGLDEETDSVSLHSSREDLGRKWRISRAVEITASTPKENFFSIAAALPVPCCGTLPFSQNECSAQHIAQQLTLLQQEMFQGCHPVHFLNSRIQGITDNMLIPNKNVSQHSPPAEGNSVQEGTLSDTHLQQLLTYADSVTNWISSEIVLCDSTKAQVALVTKYLWIGKHCYESRNFATAMQVLAGLENVSVRQLPVWKHLPSKVLEILDELRAVQVFLKSDDLCLITGRHLKMKPTLPPVHVLAMHVQQLEIGAFTLTTGAYKWSKLRGIAKVVSQVHAFQEVMFSYCPDQELQTYLQRRITWLFTSNIQRLAADNDRNFQQSKERQTQDNNLQDARYGNPDGRSSRRVRLCCVSSELREGEDGQEEEKGEEEENKLRRNKLKICFLYDCIEEEILADLDLLELECNILVVSGRPDKCMSSGDSHRLSGARSSHTHRICEDFNNEPLTPNHEDRSGFTRAFTHANDGERPGPYKKPTPPRPRPQDVHSHSDLDFSDRSRSSTDNMAKYFSVDWLAQSHRDITDSEESRGVGTDTALTHRPHIPCVVQPRPPALGKGYLQPKPKPLKTVENTESSENQRSPDSTFSSPVHPISCSSPISETSGYSSGYESEAASSECPSVDECSETDRDGPQRRVRTKFTPEQINKLEKIFNKHKYLDAGERVKTAQKLNLTETQVRTWFQNRRMKMKREVQDYLTPQVPPVMFQALAPVPYPGMVSQRPHYPSAPTHQPYYYPLQIPQMVQMPPHHPPHLLIQNPHCY